MCHLVIPPEPKQRKFLHDSSHSAWESGEFSLAIRTAPSPGEITGIIIGFLKVPSQIFFSFLELSRLTSVHSQRNSFDASFLAVVCSITVKDVKALLPQINYRVPNMRFLKDKLQVSL